MIPYIILYKRKKLSLHNVRIHRIFFLSKSGHIWMCKKKKRLKSFSLTVSKFYYVIYVEELTFLKSSWIDRTKSAWLIELTSHLYVMYYFSSLTFFYDIFLPFLQEKIITCAYKSYFFYSIGVPSCTFVICMLAS